MCESLQAVRAARRRSLRVVESRRSLQFGRCLHRWIFCFVILPSCCAQCSYRQRLHDRLGKRPPPCIAHEKVARARQCVVSRMKFGIGGHRRLIDKTRNAFIRRSRGAMILRLHAIIIAPRERLHSRIFGNFPRFVGRAGVRDANFIRNAAHAGFRHRALTSPHCVRSCKRLTVVIASSQPAPCKANEGC